MSLDPCVLDILVKAVMMLCVIQLWAHTIFWYSVASRLFLHTQSTDKKLLEWSQSRFWIRFTWWSEEIPLKKQCLARKIEIFSSKKLVWECRTIFCPCSRRFLKRSRPQFIRRIPYLKVEWHKVRCANLSNRWESRITQVKTVHFQTLAPQIDLKKQLKWITNQNTNLHAFFWHNNFHVKRSLSPRRTVYKMLQIIFLLAPSTPIFFRNLTFLFLKSRKT